MFFTLLLIGCQSKSSTEEQVEPRQFDQSLADELKALAEVDQVAANIPQGEYTKLSKRDWHNFKDSVFRANQIRAAQLLEKHGFIGYDFEIGRAFPINLGDSASVDVRRKALGMESLESYLNEMTEMHFMMNKGYYSEKGITSPSFYPIEK